MAACFLHVRSREFGECGEFRGSKELVSLEECNSDIGNHLSRCHLSREVSDNAARGIFLSDSDTKERDGDLRKTSSLSRRILGKPDKDIQLSIPRAQRRNVEKRIGLFRLNCRHAATLGDRLTFSAREKNRAE